MRIAVFGASRGVGAQILPQAVDREWGVKALSRVASAIPEIPGVQVIEGNVLDPGAVFRTLDGCDAAVLSLGRTKNNPATVVSDGTEIVIQVMNKLGVRRLVAVTSLGVGDSETMLPFHIKLLMKSVLKRAIQEKQRQEELIAAGGLEWVIVRPARLTDGPYTGRYAAGLSESEAGEGRVSRADVADFVLNNITDDRYLHSTPFVM